MHQARVIVPGSWLAEASDRVPYVRVGSLIRLNIDEVMAWAKRCTEDRDKHGIEAAAGPDAERRTLLQALAALSV